MIIHFTKYDIIELLCISLSRFDKIRTKLNITPIKTDNVYLRYSVQDLIDIYRYINRKKVIILESKINYKELW